MACLLNVTFTVESHRDFKRDPTSAKSLAVLYRIVAASGSLPQQNFDFGRRSYTPPCAQDDIQRFCFAIRVRKKRAIRESPLRKITKFIVGSIHESTENERISRTKAGEHSSPLRGNLKFIVGDDILGIPPKPNAHHQTNNQPVILSGEKRSRFAQSKFC